MSRICQLTGKKPITGNNVSKSNRKTKRWFRPNIHSKRFFVPETGKWITLKISSSALRTIDKKGVYQFLKECEAKGMDVPSYK